MKKTLESSAVGGAIVEETDLPRSLPQVGLLSNGRYSVLTTEAGASANVWRGLDVTRWRDDPTCQCWGQFCYVRDLDDDKVWSTGLQPVGSAGDLYDAVHHSDRAKFRRFDGDIETSWAVCVPPNVDAEVRLLTIANHGTRARRLEFTSYSEVCLNHRRADQAHPAFAKLFLETSFDPSTGSLLARRRPRGANEKPLWAIHSSICSGPTVGAIEYETDRARFLGRGRTPANPQALDSGSVLSGTTGPVLDSIFSLRRRVDLEAGATVKIAFVTGAADTREDAVATAERFNGFAAVEEAFTAALAAARQEQQEFSWTPEDVGLFNRLASAVVFGDARLREPAAVAGNRLGQSGLWPHAISGDLPIILVRVADDTDIPLVLELMQFRLFARRRGLDVDLVVLDGRAGETAATLKEELEVGATDSTNGKPGGLFVLDEANVSPTDSMLLAAAARVVFSGGGGSLTDRLDAPSAPTRSAPLLRPTRAVGSTPSAPLEAPGELQFWNGFGGFRPDGREYVIVIDDVQRLPPAPWTNVLANPEFGCLVTEGGLGYTWSGNSQTNRLTPWANDPVSNAAPEVVYLRDEETGEFWTPTPAPCGAEARVVVEHGQGFTRYTRQSHGLRQEVLVFVPPEDPVKVVRLRLSNIGDRPRKITATYYAEWALGSVREQTSMNVVSERDADSGAILARNAWSSDFGGKHAFAAANPSPRSTTGDRADFLGRNGALSQPAALSRTELSERFGACLDPCAALMSEVAVAPGKTAEVVFVLGQADDVERVRSLVRSYANPGHVDAALRETLAHWDQILERIQVTTPDAGMNVMLNRWLLYQVLVCRLWARSALYQSGGAYGFRDQLQDVMALVYSAPAEARSHILRAAARQFEEGDVQHWWHPPSGAGVRTRITDDLYFLPLVVHHYVTTTGDVGLLDELVPYITSPVLNDDQEEVFNAPAASDRLGTIYEHCERALERGHRLGEHGLPLMGTGDWNDGMNKVGAEGKGESVWNGWFFVGVLKSFAEVAARRGDESRAAWCIKRAEALRSALEANAWDGEWYRRAYFDDGTPLGSSQNDECQIDQIPQAWAVISGAANPERARTAMEAVHRRLVRRDDKLIQLFDPPFDKGSLQPGYIKGYVPGIRENGGQYTHAATWVVLATALQGDGDRAVELWNIINPVYHALTPEEVHRYKVEPYVVCADVYGAPPHSGRGGWTWYTGSASWLYRVGLESIIGFKRKGDSLRIDPCLPKAWKSCEITYRHGNSTYRIHIDNTAGIGRGVRSTSVDGRALPDGVIALRDDGATHEVGVTLG